MNSSEYRQRLHISSPLAHLSEHQRIQDTLHTVEHCLIVCGDNLSVSVATYYKQCRYGKVVTENTTTHLLKSEYQSNASFIQLGDDSTGLWMGCLTLEVKV